MEYKIWREEPMKQWMNPSNSNKNLSISGTKITVHNFVRMHQVMKDRASF